MRRLSAFMMIAALVAALVPSAALAGKPVPNIYQVSAVSNGEVAGVCQVEVAASFTGRAFEVYFEQVMNGAGVGPKVAPADNKAGRAIAFFPAPLLGSADYSWGAVLRDRKGNEISLKLSTGVDTWTGTGCEVAGRVVAVSA